MSALWQGERAHQRPRLLFIYLQKKKKILRKKKTKNMYSNNLKIQFSQDLEVYINNNTNNLHRIQGDHFRFFFYRCLYKWLLRLGEIKHL